MLRPYRSLRTLVIVAACWLTLAGSPASAQVPVGLVVDSPCPGPGCTAELQPHAQGRRVVYLNFDGVTLSRSNTNDDARLNVSAIVNSSTEVVPAFDPGDLSGTSGLSRAQIIDRVVSDLYVIHQPYDIDFVTSRPASGNYSMVVFGGSCSSVVGQGCAGIALRDCDDRMPSNITFVFPPGLRVSDLATTAAQEAAHAWGLGHTDDRDDVMYPTILASVPRAYGAGNIMGANGQHDGSGCPSSVTYQDSHARLLQNIGPRGQDTTPPSVTITEPREGDTIYAGSIIRANATDNLAVDKVELLVDGAIVRELSSSPWEFALAASTPHGEHSLTVRATDISGNSGQSQIRVFVNTQNVIPCSTDDQCEGDTHCNGQVCVPNDPTPDPDPNMFEPCQSGGDCVSGVCVTVGEESLCSQTCSDNAGCPAGAECLDGAACWPVADGGGPCNAGSRGGHGLAALMLLALVAVARRRS